MNQANKKAQWTIVVGGLLAFLAVALGAFGAHAWSPLLAKHGTEAIFATASDYQFFHALALIVIGTLARQTEQISGVTLITAMMSLGTVIFSGSLYILSLSGIRWLGAITPIGGTLLLLAWGIFIWKSWIDKTT